MNHEVKFSNYSMKAGNKYENDSWEWCIFVDDDDSVIREIKQVEYTLHHTFPDPIRTVTDRRHRFALYSSGWGQFTAHIEIMFNDNSVTNQSYIVRFADGNWPVKDEPSSFDEPDEKAVYYAIKDEKYRWRKTSTIVKSTNLPNERVFELLTALEDKDLVRKSPFKAIDMNDMWGITAIVGCYPPRLTGI
jgi:transcription initiation factor IIF auxiliary subunit